MDDLTEDPEISGGILRCTNDIRTLSWTLGQNYAKRNESATQESLKKIKTAVEQLERLRPFYR